MFEETDIVIFLIGALAGAIVGYWIRDRQSRRQKLRFNSQRASSRTPPEQPRRPD